MTFLDSIEEKAQSARDIGVPIISREKAQWLLEQVQTRKPKKVFELGTAVGYSGVILGSEGAKVITVDRDKRAIETAQVTFAQFETKATIIVGDGVTITKQLHSFEHTFDLIFIDFEKKKYIEVLDYCLKMIEKNGVIIADNVTNPKCESFMQLLKEKQLDFDIIDIGDGLALIRSN